MGTRQASFELSLCQRLWNLKAGTSGWPIQISHSVAYIHWAESVTEHPVPLHCCLNMCSQPCPVSEGCTHTNTNKHIYIYNIYLFFYLYLFIFIYIYIYIYIFLVIYIFVDIYTYIHTGDFPVPCLIPGGYHRVLWGALVLTKSMLLGSVVHGKNRQPTLEPYCQTRPVPVAWFFF